MSLPAEFAAKTVESTCIVWTGANNGKGYGVFIVNGAPKLAHRVAYEDAHGPIPVGLVIDHLCRVRNCVRVDHLEAVTVAENTRRGRTSNGLHVGDSCINGHELTDESHIYRRPSGATECQACRAAGNHGKKRPTAQRRAATTRAVHAA